MKLLKCLSVFAVTLLLFGFAPEKKITIFTIGDSTCANKTLENQNLERGWGQALSSFFDERYVVVDNHAQNGRSSLSFLNEGRWKPILDKIQKGDYVLIQFGHNDEKPDSARHTDPATTYKEILKKYVTETRLTFDNFATRKTPLGENMGTSGSSSMYIYATGFEAENMTFENSAGSAGQAVAVFVAADQVAFRHCRFLGNQDALYTWGKPDAEKTTYYGEYATTGSGANAKDRTAWSHQLTKKEAETYSIKDILAARDGWNPLK